MFHARWVVGADCAEMTLKIPLTKLLTKKKKFFFFFYAEQSFFSIRGIYILFVSGMDFSLDLENLEFCLTFLKKIAIWQNHFFNYSL